MTSYKKSRPSSAASMVVLLLTMTVSTTEANTFNCPFGDLTSAVSTEINVGLGGTVQCTEAQLLAIGNAVDHAYNPAIAGTVLEESFEFSVHVSADPTNSGSRRLLDVVGSTASNLRPPASHRQLSYGGFSYSGGGQCRHCQPDPDCCNRRDEETSPAEETDEETMGDRHLEAFDPTELGDLQTTIGSAIKAHLEATLVADANSCIYQETIAVAVTLTEE